MLLPLSDSPNTPGLPVANYALIGLNVAVFVLVTMPLGMQPADAADPVLQDYLRMLRGALPADVFTQAARQVSQYDLFVYLHGFRPAAPEAIDVLSAMFLHGGFGHLFGNMLFLWIYGDNVERHLGSLRYLWWYLLTGVAATALHFALSPGSPIPTVGASGAISGVLGFYFHWFPRNTVRLLMFFPPFLWQTVEVSARFVLGFYLVADNLLPLLVTSQDGGGVAYGAHIGGFLAGWGVAWARDRLAEQRGVPAEVAPALREGADALAIATRLRDDGDAAGAAFVLRRALHRAGATPHAARMHTLLGLIEVDELGDPVAAYQHFVDALRANPEPDVAAAARQGIAATAALQKFRVGRPARRRAF